MNYLEYEVEDFLLDSSFRNYCLGTNQEDVAFWEQWMVLHPEKYELVREAQELYRLLNGDTGPDAVRLASEQFHKRFEEHEALGNKVELHDTSVLSFDLPFIDSRNRRVRKLRYWLGAAALVGFIVLAVALWQRPGPAPAPAFSAGRSMVSKAGERRSFQLPDGTKVILNAGSSLQVPDDFNGTAREITLLGEAFFDVARDPQKVFLIHTSSADIRVLGTSFNVKAYKDEMESETSLLTGSLEVQVKGRNNAVVLRPGEKIVVPNADLLPAKKTPLLSDAAMAKTAYRIEKININPADSSLAEVSWIQNKLVFNDDSFAEIAAALARYYNTSILFEDEEVKRYRFTGSFEKKSLEQVLEALAASRPFKYRQEPGNRTIISVGNMKN